MRYLHLIILCFSQWLAFGQTQLEVGLVSGEVIYPSKLVRKKLTTDHFYLLVDDSISIKMESLKYYQTASHYFLVTDLGSDKHLELKRIEHGEINLYTYSGLTSKESLIGDKRGGELDYKTFYFYEKGDVLNPLGFNELIEDLSDKPEVMNELVGVKRRQGVRKEFIATGIILTVLGLNQSVKQANAQGTSVNQSFEPNGLIVAGLAVLVVPIFFKPNLNKAMIKSIRTYNNS